MKDEKCRWKYRKGSCSYAPAVTGITTGGFRLSDNLDDLTSAQTEVFGYGIFDTDTGKLGLLQAVAIEQGLLLLRAEQDVLGNEFVLCDVDEQVGFLEDFDTDGQVGGLLESGGGDTGTGDVDSRVVVLVVQELGEVAQVLDTDG